MKETDGSNRFNRREFLTFSAKAAATAFVGAATAETLIPVHIQLLETVANITNHPSDNASLREKIENMCSNTPNPKECLENPPFSVGDKFEAIVVAPIAEELMFRALPSLIISDEEKEKPGKIPFINGGLGMTRRELIAGAISTVIYGAAHNLTSKGFDTETIPASQIFGGITYWYLQRKFGFIANTFSHAWLNFRAFQLHK